MFFCWPRRRFLSFAQFSKPIYGQSPVANHPAGTQTFPWQFVLAFFVRIYVVRGLLTAND
jgi:hypothetical protein